MMTLLFCGWQLTVSTAARHHLYYTPQAPACPRAPAGAAPPAA
jgi:hypothetical protein